MADPSARIGEDEGEFASEVRDVVSSMPLLTSMAAPEHPSHPSTLTSLDQSKSSVPEPLGPSSAQGHQGVGFALALATARSIEDLNAVPYPEDVRPNPNFNFAVTPRRFRYNREFMIKFMNVCKERPSTLVSVAALGMLGLDPATPPVARTGGRRIGSKGKAGTPQGQPSMGLGLGPSLPKGGFTMSNSQGPSLPLGDSQSRFETSTSRPGIPPTPWSASQGKGSGGPREAKRTRSQRGNKSKGNIQVSGIQLPSNQQALTSLGPVKPLKLSENRWVASSTPSTPQQLETRVLVEHKVRALLNKITMEKFDSISDQIVDWANKSEQEKDGSTLKQVVKLILRGVKEEAAFSEMYARLCRKMMERISPNVQDETIRNVEGKPITGGMLFRKHLLNQCQEFEHESSGKKTASNVGGQAVPRWGGPWSMLGAGRRGLGLACFMGELFKLQMLTERIMHEYIQGLFSNVVDPKEEDIESLCKLLTMIGQTLDKPKAKNQMDNYFDRMQELAKGNIDSRMQFMLLDVIDLRARQWHARPTGAIASIAGESLHSRTARQGGFRRGERPVTTVPKPDGWNVASGVSARPPARAGDLSQFGKISKPTGLQFGPSSVFSKKDPKRAANLARSGDASMFSALSNDGGHTAERTPDLGREEPSAAVQVGAGPVRKKKLLPKKNGNGNPSVDREPGGSLSAEGTGPRNHT